MLGTLGLWTRNYTYTPSTINRTIASDCDSIVKELISPKVAEEKLKKKAQEELELEQAYKLKTSIWNKILSAKEFENFNDMEYFRWLEIYKDSKNRLSSTNPVSIEQKMALIEVINAKLINNAVGFEKNISSDIQKLNTLKLRKLQSRMKNFDLSSKLSREDIEDFASDFMLILKGPPASLLDYFSANKTARMKERIMRMIQEDTLVMGLKGMAARVPEKDGYTRLERGKYVIKRFFQYKIWKFLVLPYDLPWIERVKIPEELLEKIMMDGIEAHDQELVTHLKKQNMIDHYERVRKVYKPIAFSLGFYFYYDKFNDKLKGELSETQEEEKQRFLEEFKNLAESILESNKKTAKTQEELQQEQLERMIQNFKAKYGESPTPEELEEIRARIFTE